METVYSETIARDAESGPPRTISDMLSDIQKHRDSSAKEQSWENVVFFPCDFPRCEDTALLAKDMILEQEKRALDSGILKRTGAAEVCH